MDITVCAEKYFPKLLSVNAGIQVKALSCKENSKYEQKYAETLPSSLSPLLGISAQEMDSLEKKGTINAEGYIQVLGKHMMVLNISAGQC